MLLTKKVVVLLSCAFFSVLLAAPGFGQNMYREINDFDGDGMADFAITRNEGGAKIWYVWQTTAGFRAFQWGINTDQNAAGDYDGDGKTDFAVYREEVLGTNSSRHSWWIYGSQSGAYGRFWNWNDPDSYARQQDYDADGKTDIAFSYGAHQQQLEILFAAGGSAAHFVPSAPPIKLGDMTGDGKADVAGYNPNTNVVSIRNSATNTVQTIPFGLAGDEFVAADFDGDSIGDLTVFRQSNGQWWWMRSSDNTVQAAAFGAPGDEPVPADYDGDGKSDLAIWRSDAQCSYWVYGSQIGVFVISWGTAGDAVVRY